MNKEQRDLARWSVNWPVKIQVKRDNLKKNFRDCYIKDLNFRGLQIALKGKLPEYDAFGLLITLAGNITLEMKVQLVSHRVLEDGLNAYSLRITRIKDSDKELIFKFLHKEFRTDLLRQWWKGIREI